MMGFFSRNEKMETQLRLAHHYMSEKCGAELNPFDVSCWDCGLDGTEGVERDDGIGLCSLADEVAFKTLQIPPNNTNAVTCMEGNVRELYRAVGVVEHEAEHLHLCFWYDGKR